VRFLVDAQLPPALVQWLAREGHVADHSAELLGPRATDHMIAAKAIDLGAIIITKDVDFVDLVAPP
jgi:predicted nuclease of predicted toxin-antitoxin system